MCTIGYVKQSFMYVRVFSTLNFRSLKDLALGWFQDQNRMKAIILLLIVRNKKTKLFINWEPIKHFFLSKKDELYLLWYYALRIMYFLFLQLNILYLVISSWVCKMYHKMYCVHFLYFVLLLGWEKSSTDLKLLAKSCKFVPSHVLFHCN